MNRSTCKYYLFVLWCFVFSIHHSTGHLEWHGQEENIKFYDDKGHLHYINLTASLDAVLDLYFTRRYLSGNTRFWLYTRDNVHRYEELFIRLNYKTSIEGNTSVYRPNRPLLMLTHGWMTNGHSKSTQLIKNAYLKVEDANVVIVDWEKDAAHENYFSSAALTMIIAEKVKDMVLSLANRHRLDSNDVHLIGHSLGAHVMGLAGEKLKNEKFTIARVTGLDPAGPFFELPNYLPGISNDAADFVDVIHTNCGLLGCIGSLGHADFYPNGGNWQPHCCDAIDSLSCEHKCAYVYFAESIKGWKYSSVKCDSYIDYLMDSCVNNEKEYMGLDCAPTARGSYYLDIDN